MPNLRQFLDEAAMVALTRRLVEVPSENPPGVHYEDCVQLLLAELTRLRFEQVRREGDCVLASVGTGVRPLVFSGHYDVVPAQSALQFETRVEGANLFGRGSSDMKGGLASMIHAAVAVRDAGQLGGGCIQLVFVPDEETAGTRGTRMLAGRGLLASHAYGMLTPEPTGGVVWHANRGAVTLRATMRGKSTHVGRQFEGVNAFEQCLPVWGRLAALKRKVEHRLTRHTISPAAARASILMLGGEVRAGTNFNVTPESCSFTVDRRINPEEDLHAEKARLLEALAGCEIEILQEEASASTAPEVPLGRALAQAVATVTGHAPAFELCPGLLETRFYARCGVPAFAYGPGLLTVSHGPNEFVPLRNLTACAEVYAHTAAILLDARE